MTPLMVGMLPDNFLCTLMNILLKHLVAITIVRILHSFFKYRLADFLRDDRREAHSAIGNSRKR